MLPFRKCLHGLRIILLVFVTFLISSTSLTPIVTAAPLVQTYTENEPNLEGLGDGSGYAYAIPSPEVVFEFKSNASGWGGENTIGFTFAITNNTASALTTPVITTTIPPTLTYSTSPGTGLLYNDTTRVLTWNTGKINAGEAVSITYVTEFETLTSDQFFVSALLTDPSLTNSIEEWDVVTLGSPPANSAWITPKGGQLQATSYPVSVIALNHAFATPYELTIQDSLIVENPDLWQQFVVSALNTGGTLVQTLPTTVTLAVDLKPVWSTVSATTGTPSLYKYDSASALWVLVPSRMDWGSGYVYAEIQSLGEYGVGTSLTGSYGASAIPTLQHFSSDEWSGNSSAQYPLTLPPAPGNLPFSLNFNYSSEGVNGLFARRHTEYNATLALYSYQASVIGWGWNLSGLGDIRPNGANHAQLVYPGGSVDLIRRDPLETPNSHFTWQTEPQLFAKIRSLRDHGSGLVPEPDARKATMWEVYTHDGLIYTFGHPSVDGNGVAYNLHTSGCSNYHEPREIHLTSIRDIYNNTVTIEYEKEAGAWVRDNGCSGGPVTKYYTKAIYPRTIYFLPGGVSANATTKIELNYASRSDRAIEGWQNPSVQRLYSDKRLDTVQISVRDSANTFAPYRRYQLVQDYDVIESGTERKIMRLRSVLDDGRVWNDGVTIPEIAATNLYDYGYLPNLSAYKTTNVLITGRNGQGGTVAYSYDRTPNFTIWGCPTGQAYRYFVKQTDMYDGIRDYQNGGTLYDLPSPRTVISNSGAYAHVDEGSADCSKDFDFGGYATVTSDIKQPMSTVASADLLIKRTINNYLQTASGMSGTAPWAGRLERSKVFDASNVQLTETYTEWQLNNSYATAPAGTTNSYWVLKRSEQTTSKGQNGNPDLVHSTSYLYDPAWQYIYTADPNDPDGHSPSQFGLPTRIEERVNGATLPYRVSHNWYIADNINLSYFVVPLRTQTHELTNPGTSTYACRAESLMAYGNAAYGSHPVAPGLTHLWIANTESVCNIGTPTPNSSQYALTLNEYDAWGNQSKTTSPDGRITRIRFDTSEHYATGPRLYALPRQSINALNDITHYEWTTGQGTLVFTGQVTKVTDANNVSVYYTYDDFERALKVVLPGDDMQNPTTETIYHDFTGPYPFAIETRERTNPSGGAGAYAIGLTFYDGLGRTIQQRHSWYEPFNNGLQVGFDERWKVSLTTYDTLGGAKRQYISVSTPTTTPFLTFYEPLNGLWSNQPYTSNVYDALGRTLEVRAPDNTVAYHQYGTTTEQPSGIPLTWHDIRDAENHRTQYRYDTRGRLVRVHEISGHCGNFWGVNVTCPSGQNPNYALATTTQYEYDYGDRLTYVRDNEHNVNNASQPWLSKVTYDFLGRKQTLEDRNMGTWSYAYDKDGNLIRQTDSRGKRVCYFYDGINRIIGKTYITSDNCGTVAPTSGSATSTVYLYDINPDQADTVRDSGFISFRTKMLDGSGETRWIPDQRGRVLTEKRTITGAGTFATSFTYDSFNRIRSVLYPSNNTGGQGELVTNYYRGTQQLELASVSNTLSPYISAILYNVHGQPVSQKIGPTIYQSFEYWPITTERGQGRLRASLAGTTSGGSNLQYLEYEDAPNNNLPGYDRVGNITDIHYRNQSLSFTYTYDHRDRLTAYAQTSSSVGETYGYDSYGLGNLKSIAVQGGSTYTYNYGAQSITCPTGARDLAHAAVSDGRWDYCYDEAGNMVRRSNGTNTDTFSYDSENRLTILRRNATDIYTMTYDGDGKRVKSYYHPTGTSHYFVNQYVEIRNGSIVKQYYADSTQIALQESSGVYYLLTDHLGSTSVTVNASGTIVGEQRYKPFGDDAFTSGDLKTDKRFTGQYEVAAMDLYYFNARYYNPVSGRFAQADGIVPNITNPQSLNRYSYTLNNPLKYTDPSGNTPEGMCHNEWCWKNRWYNARGIFWNPGTHRWDLIGEAQYADITHLYEYLADMGLHLVNPECDCWSRDELYLVGRAVADFANKIGSHEQLKHLVGFAMVERKSTAGTFDGCGTGSNVAACANGLSRTIYFYDGMFSSTDLFAKGTVVHELAHMIDFTNMGFYGHVPDGLAFSMSYAFPGNKPSGLANLDEADWAAFPGNRITEYGNESSKAEYFAEAVALWVYPGYKIDDKQRGVLLTGQIAYLEKVFGVVPPRTHRGVFEQ